MQTINIYELKLTTIQGTELNMEDYRGKALLIVNTASKCGFTKQYKDLQELYDRYKERGLLVLGFPANNFMNQEPEDNQNIEQFCRLNYGVSFPMFAKVSVRGKDIHPLYKFLTEKESNPNFSGKITWNFNKFLVSPQGEIVGRFASRVNPLDKQLIRAIEGVLPL